MKLKRLRIYSCSHGLLGKTSNNLWQEENTWGYHLANKYGLEYINKSKAGYSNFHIFRTVYNDLKELDSNDLVFVQWSHTNRAWALDQPSVLPLNNDKLSKIYFKNLYNDLQEINKVIGYTLILDKLINNFVFNFFEGESYFKGYSSETWPLIAQMPNYLNVNDRAMNHIVDKKKFPCMHFDTDGHQEIADLYSKKLEIYLSKNT